MDYTALALTLAVFGVLMIFISYQRHRHARDVSAVLHGVAGIALVIGGALLFELALNLNTYQDAQRIAPLAEITFNTKKDGSVEVKLVRIPDGELQVFNLVGTRWRMTVQLIHWRRWIPWFGITHQIRLSELISSTDAPVASGTPSSISYSLTSDGGINLWRWGLRQHGEKAWVRTEVLESPAMPFESGQRVQVYLGDGALLIHPIQKKSDNGASKLPQTPVLNQRARELLRNSDLTVGSTAETTPTTPSPAGKAD